MDKDKGIYTSHMLLNINLFLRNTKSGKNDFDEKIWNKQHVKLLNEIKKYIRDMWKAGEA